MRRSIKEILILLVVVALIAVFVRDKGNENAYPTVNLKLSQVSRDEALQAVCEEMGFTLVGRELDLTASDYLQDYNFVDEPVEKVLSQVAGQWKLLDHHLLLIPDRSQVMECGIRMEYLLENVPAEDILLSFKNSFPDVRFTYHPTMNGFYASGGKSDLLTIKRILSDVDSMQPEPIPETVRSHNAQHFTPSELAQVVNTRFPSVKTRVTRHTLKLRGTVEHTGQALRFLDEFDRKTLSITVPLNDLEETEPTCSKRGRFNPSVNCDETCQGPLHFLGLQQGDILPEYQNDKLRLKPEWWVVRNDLNYRIVLDIQP